MTAPTITKPKANTLTTETCEKDCATVARFRYRNEETGKTIDLCDLHSDVHGPALDELEFRIVAWRER